MVAIAVDVNIHSLCGEFAWIKPLNGYHLELARLDICVELQDEF